MRTTLAWMLLCAAAVAQRPEPGVPPGWTVYVVHAPWCAPCQRFRRDYDTIAEFRGLLESAFAVKSCEWERNNDQRFARRFGISSLPGFIVFRNGVHQYSFSGYNGDWKAFCEKLNLDASGADGAESGKAKSGTPQEPIRPITPVERSLPEIADLRAELDRLRRQMAEAAKPKTQSAQPLKNAVPGVLPGTQPAALPGRQAEATPLPPVLSIPAVEAPAGGGSLAGSGVGAEWAKVGAAVLALAAPQFAIPAGALSMAATAYQMLRRRRQAMQAQQQQHRQTVVERPIPVAMPAVPQQAQVVTQNQYVPIDTDSTADALAWATAQMVKQYPGTEGAVAMLSSLMEQHKAAQSGGRNSGHK